MMNADATNQALNGDGMSVRRERTLRHIALVAFDQFRRHGLGRATMTMVATSAGISRKTLYEYAPTKSALVRAVLDEISIHLAEAIHAIVIQDDRPVIDRFRAVFGVVASGLRDSHRVLNEIAIEFPEEWQRFETQRAERAARNFAKLAADGIRDGAIRTDIPVSTLVEVYLAFVRGVLSDPGATKNAEALFEQGVSLILEGMIPRKR